jgi:chromosomal replication initiation ATPase DnaA
MSHLVQTKDYSDVASMLADAKMRRALFYTKREEPKPLAPTPRPRRVSLSQIQKDEIARAFAAWLNTAPAKIEQPWQIICRLVCAEMQIPMSELKGPTRVAKFMHARHIACWLLRRHANLSFPVIGRRLGGRDHTTIMNSCRRVDEMRERDGAFRVLIDDLSAKIVERLPQ